MPYNETVQSVLSGTESEHSKIDSVGPVGPYVTFDHVQPVADGPVGPYITLSPVGSSGMHPQCDSDRPVADGPVGPSVTLSPVGSDGMFSQCDSDQPVADGPVGPPITLGPVDPCGMLSQCNSDQLVADGPVGPSVALGLVGPRGMFLQCDTDQLVADGLPGHMSLQIDIDKEIFITDEPASSVGISPSSDSGIHSFGEQWEDASVVTTDAEEEQNSTSRICSPTQQCVIDTCVPANAEEDNVTLHPLMDCLLSKRSEECPEVHLPKNDLDAQLTEAEEDYSDQDLVTDESSRGLTNYKTCRLYRTLWVRRKRRTSTYKDRFNSGRTVVRC